MKDVLLIASAPRLEDCARALEEQLGAQVVLTVGRMEALELLRRRAFGVVVIEECLIESDSAWADRLWGYLGFAVPLQVNFGILGCARLKREIMAALLRRQNEQAVARRAVASEIEDELNSSLTGLLLQSELALQEPAVPAALEPKLRQMVELAGSIRENLRRKAAE